MAFRPDARVRADVAGIDEGECAPGRFSPSAGGRGAGGDAGGPLRARLAPRVPLRARQGVHRAAQRPGDVHRAARRSARRGTCRYAAATAGARDSADAGAGVAKRSPWGPSRTKEGGVMSR